MLPLWSARLGWSLNPLCNMFMSMQIHVHVHVNIHICNTMLSICPQGSYPCSDTTNCNTLTRKPPCSSRALVSPTYNANTLCCRPLIVAVHIFFFFSFGMRKWFLYTLKHINIYHTSHGKIRQSFLCLYNYSQPVKHVIYI